ncbi:MAG: ATP synthase F0 subunit B [Gemmatimonadetes bacterium]|nr:ATP synthase F0 subunit B [Gemmatimonadota bacterium]
MEQADAVDAARPSARETTMKRKAIEVAAALGLILPGAAMAAGGDGSGSGPFAGDIGNALWTLVIFLLVVWVLGRFAWGPLLNALQSRERFIRESLEEAKKDRDEAAAQLARHEERMAEARAEATAIVEEGRRDADVVKQRIEVKAQEEADKMIERARREIGIAKQTAVHDLYAQAADMATELAGRIIDKELDPATHTELIAGAIGDLGLPERS